MQVLWSSSHEIDNNRIAFFKKQERISTYCSPSSKLIKVLCPHVGQVMEMSTLPLLKNSVLQPPENDDSHWLTSDVQSICPWAPSLSHGWATAGREINFIPFESSCERYQLNPAERLLIPVTSAILTHLNFCFLKLSVPSSPQQCCLFTSRHCPWKELHLASKGN